MLNNSQDNFQLHRFTTSENIAKSYGGHFFLLTLYDVFRMAQYLDWCNVLGLESQVLGLEGQVLGLEGEVLGLVGQVLGLEGEVLGLESHVLGPVL